MSKKQDSLLRAYAKSVGGVIVTEIAVGKRSSHGERRYIDGVRIIPPRGPGKVKKLHGVEFSEAVKRKTLEAIEANEYLTRGVIGQAIVGKAMLEIQYGVYAAVPVVVCRVRDEPLEQACARLGVKVWMPRHGFLVPVPTSSKATGA